MIGTNFFRNASMPSIRAPAGGSKAWLALDLHNDVPAMLKAAKARANIPTCASPLA